MLSISTKTGDHGETGLANGQRLSKADLVFEVLGAQDELNSWLGLAIAKLDSQFDEQKNFLLKVQDDLFYIGAELARSPKKEKLSAAALTQLEKISEQLQENMAENWATQFLYPGGTETAAILDLARTVCRRFERLLIQYQQQQSISQSTLQYINRLSDYLYVLRCWVNQRENYQEKKFFSYAKKFK